MTELPMVPCVPDVVDHPSMAKGHLGTTTYRKTETNKPLPVNPNAKTGSKQKKLFAHLWTGLFMIIAVISGYILLGPASLVNAAETTAIYTVSTMNHENIIVFPDLSPHENGQASDLAAMQADMNAIMSQMESLQAGNYYTIDSYQNNTSINADKINQMSARMNELIAEMNSTYAGNSNVGIPALSAGHNH